MKYRNDNPDGDGLASELRLLPEQLKAWREESGLSLVETANRSAIGVMYLIELEKGTILPTLDDMQSLANLYQKTITIDIGYYSKD